LEAGLRFTCKLTTPFEFIGRTALESAIEAGPRRRLVSLRVGGPDAMLWGGELVLHDGEPAGQVTSAAWSATCGAAVGLAYVWRRDRAPVGADDLATGTWEVTVGDAVAPVEIRTGAFYDPTSVRVRS
jgi:4-methylaminobutanoate oxidase (formaldehyde-forming)